MAALSNYYPVPGVGYPTMPRSVAMPVYAPNQYRWSQPAAYYYPPPRVPMTYVPVVTQPPAFPAVQTITDPITGQQPEPVQTMVPEQPVEVAPAESSIDTVSNRPMAHESSAEPKQPQTFAEETGQKVGELVTRLIEENPEWEQGLKNINVDQLLANPDSFIYRIREAYQQSRVLKFVTNRFSNQIIKALPNDLEPAAGQILDWLKATGPGTGVTPALSPVYA